MKHLALAAVVVAMLSVSAMAAETEYLIASWEGVMNHFGIGTSFDSSAFTTFDGVTNGSTALELDFKPGWQQGLQSAYVNGLGPDFAPFFPQLEGATKLRLDVTTSNSLANVPMSSGIQFNLFIQGQSGNGTPSFNARYGYKLIMPVYQQNTTTATIEWDLTKDANGNPVALLPAFSPATGGWFDMRLNTNVIAGGTNPGIVIIDNLRSVKVDPEGTDLGDFNGDKTVNQADYTTWADNFNGSDSVFAIGSSNADGSVNQADYTTWADHFGQTYPASVPEPATMCLLAAGGLAMLRRGRK